MSSVSAAFIQHVKKHISEQLNKWLSWTVSKIQIILISSHRKINKMYFHPQPDDDMLLILLYQTEYMIKLETITTI